MRYFGSKVSTIETIHNLISKRMPSGSFCDPFGGIGSVGSYLKSKGYNVWSGDVLNFAHFFTDRNARKIQACRRKIRAWAQKGWLSYDERAVLLASLINNMDRVANTAGTYYA